MDTYKRLKVLVSAYACSPYQGSEPGVGWGFVSALAKHHDLWIIVEEEKFRDEIERYLSDHPELAQSMHFYYLRKRRNRWLRKLWPPSYYWYYRRWHEDALRLARKLAAEVPFDIAHQLTMVGFREPGYLWQLNIPFVWGPIGGMGLFPFRFLTKMGIYGGLYYLGYNLANILQMRFSRRAKQAAKNAGSGLIAATQENMRGAMKYLGCSSTILSEIGLPGPVAEIPTRRQPDEVLRIVWAGIHVPRKALNLGLEALAKLSHDVPWQLDILGKGPRTAAWIKLAEQLGIAEKCHFHGALPRENVLEFMRANHLLLITSLRDLTSTVTVEALAHGLPIVCPDICGFADAVDDSCGIRVPVTTPAKLVRDLSLAIQSLALDEEHRYRLARGALERAKLFAWEEKAKVMGSIYRRRIGEREADKP